MDNRFTEIRKGKIYLGVVGELHEMIRQEWIKYTEKTHIPAIGINYGFKPEGILRRRTENK